MISQLLEDEVYMRLTDQILELVISGEFTKDENGSDVLTTQTEITELEKRIDLYVKAQYPELTYPLNILKENK